jgi:hypothetical protein
MVARYKKLGSKIEGRKAKAVSLLRQGKLWQAGLLEAS